MDELPLKTYVSNPCLEYRQHVMKLPDGDGFNQANGFSVMEKLQSEQIVRPCWNAKKYSSLTHGPHAVVALHREHDMISP
jgi:hypothetical protein